MADNENKCKFKSKIGGQALIEGIMMRGIGVSAMACRLPNGTIDVETWQIKNGKDAPWYLKTPFIRGCFNFCITLRDGIVCTMKSADKQMTDDDSEEEEEPTKFEKWLSQQKFRQNFEAKLEGEKGKELIDTIMIIISVITMIISICALKFIPAFLSGLLGKVGAPDAVKTIAEGVVKITLVVGYMWAVSHMKEMHKIFMYHGAEHKTIACYEAGLPLTVENVRVQTRFHPRCGTSFIFLVVILSIIIGMMLPWSNILLRFGLQLLMLPVEASVGYELIKLAGRCDNAFTRIISAPGLWLQRITTAEPEDPQIEVAIAALTPCIPEGGEE